MIRYSLGWCGHQPSVHQDQRGACCHSTKTSKCRYCFITTHFLLILVLEMLYKIFISLYVLKYMKESRDDKFSELLVVCKVKS